jgi:ectoine hydroxylase-related dioxygenase (phytanoyl-CoA dioxygenase family)
VSLSLREDFERDGAAIVRSVVPPAELAEMMLAFTAIIPDLDYPSGEDGVLRELTGMASVVPAIAAIAQEPRFGALAAEVLGARRVQLLQDSLLYKPARDGGSVAWHQDYTYVGFVVPARVIALRIALCDEDEANGCLRVAVGSQRWGAIGEIRPLRETRVDSAESGLTEDQRAALAAARPLPLAAGDVSIHHCLTLHGSLSNRSPRPRRTIILRMFDAECRIDRSRLPPGTEAYFPTDGDDHFAEATFPVVHGPPQGTV